MAFRSKPTLKAGGASVTDYLSKILFRRWRLVLLAMLAFVTVTACRPSPLAPVASQSVQPAGDCQIVKHARGETCVPKNPQRVVVLDPGSLGNAIALGVKPVGAAVLGQFPPYFQGKVDGVTSVGTPNQPSLEKILLLKPDLILGDTRIAVYDQLSRIAPTVMTADWAKPEAEDLWKRDLKLHALALGKTTVAEQLLAAYRQRTQELQTRLGDRRWQTQVSIVNFRRDHVRIYLNDSFAGTILRDAGMPRPPAQNQAGFVERVSLEAIPKLDGDVLFAVVGNEKTSLLQQFTAHPLWSQLNAVKAKRIFEVNDETWLYSWHILGANLVLDDLFQYLVNPSKA